MTVLLVVLVVTPFTAPFAAFDVLDVASDSPHGDEKFGASDSKCTIAVATTCGVVVMAAPEVGVGDIATVEPLRPQPSRPLVLRI